MRLKKLLVESNIEDLKKKVSQAGFEYQVNMSGRDNIQGKLGRTYEPETMSSPNKPDKGLWTAFPYVKDGELTNTWKAASPSNQFEYNYEYYLKVERSPDVLQITEKPKYEDVYNEYGKDEMMGFRFLDYEKVAEDYDCVYVSGSALSVKSLWGWDVRSASWFDTNYLSLIYTREI